MILNGGGILTDTHREVLAKRSIRNKIAVPVNKRLVPGDELRALGDLVAGQYVTLIDRNIKFGWSAHLFDIYQLTVKGVELCQACRIARAER